MERSVYLELNQNVRDECLISSVKEQKCELAKNVLRDLDPSDKAKYESLCIASKLGDKNIVKLLVEYGAHYNFDCLIPLNNAIISNNDYIFLYLLVRTNLAFVDLELVNKAIKCSNSFALRVLLENGARADTIQLVFAIRAKNYDMVKLLLKYGINPNQEYNNYSNYGAYPINDAINNGDYKIVELLIEYGADVTVQDNLPLVNAILNCDFDISKLLLEHGADAKARDNKPIISAASNGCLDIVELLVYYGADVTAHDDAPLIEAGINSKLDVVKFLVEHGADPSKEINVKTWYAIQNSIIKSGKRIEDYDLNQIWDAISNKHDDISFLIDLLLNN